MDRSPASSDGTTRYDDYYNIERDYVYFGHGHQDMYVSINAFEITDKMLENGEKL